MLIFCKNHTLKIDISKVKYLQDNFKEVALHLNKDLSTKGEKFINEENNKSFTYYVIGYYSQYFNSKNIKVEFQEL